MAINKSQYKHQPPEERKSDIPRPNLMKHEQRLKETDTDMRDIRRQVQHQERQIEKAQRTIRRLEMEMHELRSLLQRSSMNARRQ